MPRAWPSIEGPTHAENHMRFCSWVDLTNDMYRLETAFLGEQPKVTHDYLVVAQSNFFSLSDSLSVAFRHCSEAPPDNFRADRNFHHISSYFIIFWIHGSGIWWMSWCFMIFHQIPPTRVLAADFGVKIFELWFWSRQNSGCINVGFCERSAILAWFAEFFKIYHKTS